MLNMLTKRKKIILVSVIFIVALIVITLAAIIYHFYKSYESCYENFYFANHWDQERFNSFEGDEYISKENFNKMKYIDYGSAYEGSVFVDLTRMYPAKIHSFNKITYKCVIDVSAKYDDGRDEYKVNKTFYADVEYTDKKWVTTDVYEK